MPTESLSVSLASEEVDMSGCDRGIWAMIRER